ncbi:DNA polymerase III subunit delta [Tessaracoccus sp. HDW20]|uniref:DNA polymerase III subunit delta n=1 Tax=Tessaracoccus coleopterorum TaxID=2714950 RepID=UPI0018D4666C|nr:DNA polymerase III subunit delta [Tessaracoccus coleopterorum]NHB83811.1 DNA polymerase III subunit delta [Tessaracoccus coleopterorum]
MAGKLDPMPAFGSSLLITGPETLLARRIVTATVAEARAERPEADFNEITAGELEDTMLSEVVGGSLFSTDIIAVIEDVGACPAGVVDQLVEVAKNPPTDLCLVLVHQGGNKGKGLIDKLKKAKVRTETVAGLKPWELPRFVAEEARRLKIRMSADAAGELVAAVGNDLRALAAAVAQLAADSDQGQIDADLIRRYFAGRAEVTSFAVADAVLAANATLAMERLRWALGTGPPRCSSPAPWPAPSGDGPLRRRAGQQDERQRSGPPDRPSAVEDEGIRPHVAVLGARVDRRGDPADRRR